VSYVKEPLNVAYDLGKRNPIVRVATATSMTYETELGAGFLPAIFPSGTVIVIAFLIDFLAP
jgi:hypothetical protein